jgi:DHA1 family tetracycline resistance protein-like MFS transporter
MGIKTGRLINIFLVVFVDMMGFGLILPLLPYYAETFGATPLMIGFLVASFAAASLVGAPLMGRLSDRYGRRPILLLSVAGTLAGYVLLGCAQPIGTFFANAFGSQEVNTFIIGVLFLSRMIDGLTGGNITVAQAYISDVTDESNRARGFGVIGSAFGLGFIIGPAAGGFLSHWGYNVPALAAACLAFINLISIFFFLPESLSKERREGMQNQHPPAVTLKALTEALNRPKVGPLLLVRFFLMMAFSMFMTVFVLLAQHRLNLNSQSTGFVLTYIGLYSVLVQTVGIGILTKHFKDGSLIVMSLWLMFVGYIGWAITPNHIIMLIAMLPLAGGGWIANTIIASGISKAVAPEEIGGMLGISTSVENITRVISPIIGGLLFGSFGMWAIGLFSAIMILMAVWLAYRRIIWIKEKEVEVILPVEECFE